MNRAKRRENLWMVSHDVRNPVFIHRTHMETGRSAPMYFEVKSLIGFAIQELSRSGPPPISYQLSFL